MHPRYLIGIDEAGRGPLAGPVAVGAVAVPIDFDFARVAGAKDSKQMTPKAREKLFTTLEELMGAGALRFHVALTEASIIDTEGIVPSIRKALLRAIEALEVEPVNALVKLDGGLYAPAKFLQQETIIKGDVKEPVISLASIVAKVTRDRIMTELAHRYPQYQFEVHKGYGTAKHQQLIREHGLSDMHRKTFCRSLTEQRC